MKKNLRRIMLLSLAIMAIGKCIYATDGSTSMFSGYMKFVFIGIAVILLVAILFLSYKLDKEEHIVANEGTVSKKKLGNKSKNKTSRKKEDLYSSFSDTNEEDYESDDEYYETNLNQNDFDSEEVENIEEDNDEENLYQEIDNLDDEYEEIDEDDELSNEINSLDNESYEEYNELDDTEETEENEELDFDASILDDLDDYEDPKAITKTVEAIEEDDEVEFDFDTSVLDDLDDYESPNTIKKVEENFKPLSNTNMAPKSTKRFTSTASDSSIGFRNKTTTSNNEIGFRNEEKEENSAIGFKRKNKKEEAFSSEDFLSQMEENLKATKPTTSKTKKENTTTAKITSKRKKTE